MDLLYDTIVYDGLANLFPFSPGDDSAKTPAKPPAAKASAAEASAAATPGAQQPLPPGWKKHRSSKTGEAYYRNREKGLTQWARPVCEEGDGGDQAPAHGGQRQHGAQDDGNAGRKLRAAEPESKETVTQKVADGCTAFGSNAEFVMSSKSTQVASCTSNASADGGDVQRTNRAEIEIDEEYQIAALTHRLIEKVGVEEDEGTMRRIVRSRMVNYTRKQKEELVAGLKIEAYQNLKKQQAIDKGNVGKNGKPKMTQEEYSDYLNSLVKLTGSPYATGRGGKANWKSTMLAERTPGVDEYTHVADPPRRFLSKELHVLECQRKGTPIKKGVEDGDIPGQVEDAVFNALDDVEDVMDETVGRPLSMWIKFEEAVSSIFERKKTNNFRPLAGRRSLKFGSY